jgi:hypothetical protein
VKTLRTSRTGQLLLPIVAVLFLFACFWIVYVRWCLKSYWKMRMDIAADFTALSVARQQAALLNYMATCQMSQNALIQKVSVKGQNIAHIQKVAVKPFELYNGLLKATYYTFIPTVVAVAQTVARSNGATLPALTKDNLGPRLEAQPVRAIIFHAYVPVGAKNYKMAYFTRQWSPRIRQAQPPHQSTWGVCRGLTCGVGKAQLWLDVSPDNDLNNGGFPSENASLWRQVGIQCFFPQFNARRLPKQ